MGGWWMGGSIWLGRMGFGGRWWIIRRIAGRRGMWRRCGRMGWRWRGLRGCRCGAWFWRCESGGEGDFPPQRREDAEATQREEKKGLSQVVRVFGLRLWGRSGGAFAYFRAVSGAAVLECVSN